MQHYSHPEVFFCPYYNFPGIANPKMHISEAGFDRPPRLCPAPGPSQGLRVLATPTLASPSASPQSPSPCSRGNSLAAAEPRSQGSERERKAEEYERIFEELIDAE